MTIVDLEACSASCSKPQQKCRLCIAGLLCLPIIIVVITVLASIRDLEPNEQLLIKSPSGYQVKNGPWMGVLFSFHEVQERKATLLEPEQYAIVKNYMSGVLKDVNGPQLFFLGPYDQILRISRKVTLHEHEYAVLKNEITGVPRHESGPQLLHPGIYDKVVEVKPKIVLQKDQYIQLVDEVTGDERVVRGPQTFVPKPLELAPKNTQRALFLDKDLAALVLDRSTGRQHLVTQGGAYAPGPYEEVVEQRPLIHLLPHEAITVRDAEGQLEVHKGTDGAEGVGMSFFLPPYCQIEDLWWSDHSKLANAAEKVKVQKIDLRAHHIFFKYEVRTSDNVKLSLEGTIFWQITNVSRLISATPDPEGDVWHHARSSLIEAVSNATLAEFMQGFNRIVMESFQRDARVGFYVERGVELRSMELTRYDCTDIETAKILQEIIQETTNRINRLTAQQSENDVKASALAQDVKLERQRTELIRTRAENERLAAEMKGEAVGLEMARGAATFIGGLNHSVPSVDRRVELYRLHQELDSRNVDTKNLASGKAHLFVTPSDLKLRLDTTGATGSEL
jgi:regulator of protease activity HflC (stomatin/prohibitin superfamily)